MNTRLQQFLTAENISQAQFADSIKVARASVSHILAGRNKPGYDFILNMMKSYPNLNIEWLMSGKGKMYKNASEDLFSTAAFPESNSPSQTVIPEPTATQEKISDAPAEFFPNFEISEASEEKKDREQAPQSIVRQRKAVRIMVFYDDNTFEEFKK